MAVEFGESQFLFVALAIVKKNRMKLDLSAHEAIGQDHGINPTGKAMNCKVRYDHKIIASRKAQGFPI